MDYEAAGRAKAQAAMEFLATYVWALIIIVLALAAIYVFAILPSTAVTQQCSFQYAVTCKDMGIGSNSVGTSAYMVLLNGQSQGILNPKVTVNSGMYGSSNALCAPSAVPPGGAILCDVVFPSIIPDGTTVSGSMSLAANVCISGTLANCQIQQPVTYTGNFTEQAANAVNILPLKMSLSAEYPTVSPGQQDKLTAVVDLYGQPLAGAYVSFTSPESNVIFVPSNSISDGTGSAFTEFSTPAGSAASGYTITARFAGVDAQTSIST